ncbi:MAG TPA: phosphatase PAP2 family protein [Pyrinomonadaceae bacterium]
MSEERAEAKTSIVSRAGRLRAARRLWRAETAYFAALAAFAVLAVFARVYAYFGWDQWGETSLQNLSAPGFAALMRAASMFGNGVTPYVLTAVTVLAFLILGRRSEPAALTFSVAGGELLNRIIKWAIARPRPSSDLVRVIVHPGSESFPSGHVTFYVCYFGFLFFVAYALLPRGSTARRVALVLSALPVLLVGLSRVYLGAHWPSDTLGAYLFSGLWLAFSIDMYRRWKQRATFHPEAQIQKKE